MKKNSAVCMLLCLAMLLQLLCVPVLATETEDIQSTEDTLPIGNTQELAFGQAPTARGCRTLNAQVPLDGSERMLESAQAAFVYERNTGTVIYSYNPDTTRSPGALTKIVSAIVAIENGNLDDEVTIRSTDFDYLPQAAIKAELKNEDVMTLRDLLHHMILGMANDAAVTIAVHVGGTESNFISMMNQKVQEIGCTGTVFANCHGIDNEGQYSTARDLAKIVDYAMKNPTFAELFGTSYYTVPKTLRAEEKELMTKNYLLEQTDITKYIDYSVTGGVATYTNSSGSSIVFTAEENGLSLIVVLLGCRRDFNEKDTWRVEYYGNFEESLEILAYAFDNFKICRLLHEGQSMSQFVVANGVNQVVGQTHTSMDVVLPKDAHLKNLILKYNLVNGSLTAPIVKDQKIATLEVCYRNSTIAEVELYAMSSVETPESSGVDIRSAAKSDSNIGGILKFLGYACLVVLGLFVVYLVVNNIRRTIARSRRRRRRRGRRRSR